MDNIKQVNKFPTLSNINNINESQFCALPVEMIHKICTYLDLPAALNIRATCKLLNFYLIENKTLKQRYKLIYSNKSYFFTNKNISFICNLNKLLLNHLSYLSENDIKTNDAVLSIKSSKLYGFQFALVNLMSEGTYSLNVSNKIDAINLPYYVEGNTLLKFKATNYYNEYLVVTSNCLYLINLDTENKKNDIKYIGNITSFVNQKFTNQVHNILLKDNFIIINLCNNSSIILKKYQDTYINITPKNINCIYGETLLILQDSSHNYYFLVIVNNRVYECNEKQLSLINLNLHNIDNHTKDITPKNLLVSKIAASDNGNLVLFYGKNSINQMQEELQVQVNGKIINIINIPHDTMGSFICGCSPMGTSFFIKYIGEYYNIVSNKCIVAALYIIDNYGLKEMQIPISFYYLRRKFQISYKNNDLISIFNYDSEKLIFIKKLSYSTMHPSCIAFDDILRYFQKIIIFNKTKNMYAAFYNPIYNENNIEPEKRLKIKIYNIEQDRSYFYCLINCKQLVNHAIFSPNSQLVATREKYDENTTIFNTLRVYRIMKNVDNQRLHILEAAEFIAEFSIDETIENMEFHGSGFKIIINTKDSIQTLDIRQ